MRVPVERCWPCHSSDDKDTDRQTLGETDRQTNKHSGRQADGQYGESTVGQGRMGGWEVGRGAQVGQGRSELDSGSISVASRRVAGVRRPFMDLTKELAPRGPPGKWNLTEKKKEKES